MIFTRCLALRIYTAQLPRTPQSLLHRETLVAYSFGEASFAVVLHFGVVVFWNVPSVKQQQFIRQLKPYIKSSLRPELTDQLQLHVGQKNAVADDYVYIKTPTLNTIVALSFVLAQSIVLTRMEQSIDTHLQKLNGMLRQVQRYGTTLYQRRKILRSLSQMLRDRTHAFYEYSFHRTPAEVWANPDTALLYHQLVEELEIHDRVRLVNEKWETVSESLQFVLDIIKEKRGLRIELVILIIAVLVDVVLTIWQIVSA